MKAQMVAMVLEKAVTVSGNEKWYVKSHLVMRMMVEDMKYHDMSTVAVRHILTTREGCDCGSLDVGSVMTAVLRKLGCSVVRCGDGQLR